MSVLDRVNLDRVNPVTPLAAAVLYSVPMLLTIDSVLGQLNLQAPPNDGVQQVRGRIGNGVPATAAMDILSEGATNTAFLLSGGVLHTVNPENGTPTVLGPVAGSAEVIDIAAMR